MKYFKIFILIFLTFFVFSSCEEKTNEPLVSGYKAPPEIKDVEIKNVPGGAEVFYSIPESSDLLYVAAEYEDEQGEKKTIKSSQYKNSINLEGFNDERDYIIKLYTVSKSEKYSTPHKFTIHPERSPVKRIGDSLNVAATFGGLLYDFRNEFDMNLVVYTLVKNEEGKWEEYERYYTSSEEEVNHGVRGLESESTDFAFFIQDEFQNHSDTLFASLTPLYEEKFDKSMWEDADLPDDFNTPRYGPLSELWDEGGDRTYFFQDYVGHPELAGLPTWVTIDLGQEALLGRMKLFMVKHGEFWRYNSCSIREFEIWGSNHPTTDWDDWTLLGEFESIRPSGRSAGEPMTNDDQAQLDNGEDFKFPPMTETYRYIRLKVNKTWGSTNYFCSLEISLWGQKD